MRRFEKKVGEFIEYEPPRLTLVEEYVQVAAVDNQDATETTMVSAKSEPRLLSGLPGNSLLAGIATWRFADHLPYYRLEEILDRYQLRLDRATQCRWMIETAKRVQPLVDLMRSLCLSSGVVQADETPVKMLAAAKAKPTRLTYGRFLVAGTIPTPRSRLLKTDRGPAPMSSSETTKAPWSAMLTLVMNR